MASRRTGPSGSCWPRAPRPTESGAGFGDAAEAVDSVLLLAEAARAAHLHTPALDGLADLVEGRIQPESWAAAVAQPAFTEDSRPFRAA